MLGRLRLALWIAAGLAVAAFAVLQLNEPRPGNSGNGLPGQALIGGPFELTAHTGERFDNKTRLAGRNHLVFFGFTHCPDICPTTLNEISEHLDKLGTAADGLEVLFITVDPERDTPQHLATYLSSFDKRITGLTGTTAQIASVLKLYRAFAEKVPTSSGDYTMNHTATVYLFDGAGSLRSTLTFQEPQGIRQGKIDRLVKG
ncbi:MAG: SCO family protein [Hyphomicrobiaceae bacterium]|nr:SCO family protein [Hyphomicrobiaceae bacterium]